MIPPIYSYYCAYCSHETELMTSINNRPDFTNCEKCNKAANRQISTSNFHLGEGAWYHNGYSGDNNFKVVKPRKKPK